MGRNSHGGAWGEGVGGGWFRLEHDTDALAIEVNTCAWAVFAADHVQRAMGQWEGSVGSAATLLTEILTALSSAPRKG